MSLYQIDLVFLTLILSQLDSCSIPFESPVLMSTSCMLPFHAWVQSTFPCTSMQSLLASFQVLLHTRMGHSWACRKWIPREIQKNPTNQNQNSSSGLVLFSGPYQVHPWTCWSVASWSPGWQSWTVFFPSFKILNFIPMEYISSKNTF